MRGNAFGEWQMTLGAQAKRGLDHLHGGVVLQDELLDESSQTNLRIVQRGV